jgi:ABC-type sugar transport system ATPase subunit
MTVVLKDVTRVVGAVPHISEVSLTLEPGTLSVLLGPTRVTSTART